MSDEPMDHEQRESLEYWNGFYAGKAAALRNGEVIARINERVTVTPKRPPRWLTAGFWACVLLVAASAVSEIVAHDVSRTDTFCWGVSAMSVIMRLSRPRYPR